MYTCSICWPQLADYVECKMDQNFIYENITLRNITIVDPKFSYGQGMVLGNPVTPMKVAIYQIDKEKYKGESKEGNA